MLPQTQISAKVEKQPLALTFLLAWLTVFSSVGFSPFCQYDQPVRLSLQEKHNPMLAAARAQTTWPCDF